MALTNLPRLLRLPRPKHPNFTEPEKEPEEDRELFQPHWRCFCCQDSGLVVDPDWIIERYDPRLDPAALCQKLGCTVGSHFVDRGIVDERFSPALCSQLDAIKRKDWQDTARNQQIYKKSQHEKVMEAELAAQMQMPGSGDRTSLDEEQRQQKIDEVAAVAAEDWQKMSKEYLGSG